MTYLKLETLLLIINFYGGLADAVFELPVNKDRRLLEYAEGSSTSNPEIALYLDQLPKDITKGFVFGSDPRSCDVLLADTKSTGISANQFSIHVDCISRDPMITSLSNNDIRVKAIGARAGQVLPKQNWQKLGSGTTWNVHIRDNLSVIMFSPDRKDLQAAYERNLQRYFLEYKNAVPELANISLRDDEVTPLILERCAGLEGKEYYSTKRVETGDVDYDSKVLLYLAKCKPTLDMIQRTTGGYDDVENWILSESNSKSDRPSGLYAIKHFRYKKSDAGLPGHFPELCRLSHMNLEGLVDMISETSVFMTVTNVFSSTTLHALQKEEEPLSTKEVGFMMGQIFAALEYLHTYSWIHSNLDPRSIQVMSQNHLSIKLTDTALSSYVNLEKPDNYHATYASQDFKSADKSLADIWSAGVVALELLHPKGLPHNLSVVPSLRVKRLAKIAADMYDKDSSDVWEFVKSLLKREVRQRPTATEVLRAPFINRLRGEFSVNNRHYNFPTPDGSRHPSLGPSDAPQASRETSLGPSEVSYDPHDESDGTSGPGFMRSQSRSSAGKAPVTDWAKGTGGWTNSQREAESEEDSGEETETGPVTKKPRRVVQESTHQKAQSSRGKKPC